MIQSFRNVLSLKRSMKAFLRTTGVNADLSGSYRTGKYRNPYKFVWVRIAPPSLGLLLCYGCSKDLSRSNAVELLERNTGRVGLGKVEIPKTVLQCGIQQGLWREVHADPPDYTVTDVLDNYIVFVYHLLEDETPELWFRVHPTVTGIREGNKPTISLVDYTWAADWTTLPPQAKVCILDSLRLSGSGTATFERYDDGWRLQGSR
jgi:hypothetical protein